MNIIFLDIDGVLNSDEFFDDERHKIMKEFKETKLNNKNLTAIDNFDLLVDWTMLRIDFLKLEMVKVLSKETKSGIVMITSWRNLEFYDFIENRLKELELPIVGKIEDEIKKDYITRYDRGMGIRNYLANNNVLDYVILDDETRDYDDTLLKKLVKTNPELGLTDNEVKKIKSMFTSKTKNR